MASIGTIRGTRILSVPTQEPFKAVNSKTTTYSALGEFAEGVRPIGHEAHSLLGVRHCHKQVSIENYDRVGSGCGFSDVN